MRRRGMLFLILMAAICATVALQDGVARAAKAADPNLVAEAINAFAVDLYPKLADEKDNSLFSPYSISVALAMTYAGARGDTETQMAKVLHFADQGQGIHPLMSQFSRELLGSGLKGGKIAVANSLWGQAGYSFSKQFLNVVARNYEGGFNEVNFKGFPEQARSQINKWVEDRTEKKIVDLIPPRVITSLTRLVLTNTIYFKGLWAKQFKKEENRGGPFQESGWQSNSGSHDAPSRQVWIHESRGVRGGGAAV